MHQLGVERPAVLLDDLLSKTRSLRSSTSPACFKTSSMARWTFGTRCALLVNACDELSHSTTSSLQIGQPFNYRVSRFGNLTPVLSPSSNSLVDAASC